MSKATSIQIYQDVKERLEKEKKNDQETFNDVLRRVFNMNEKSFQPHYYRADLQFPALGQLPGCGYNELHNRILENPEYDGCQLFAEMEINGIKVLVSIRQNVSLSFIGKTKEEVDKKMETVMNGNPYELQEKLPIKYSVIGTMTINAETGERIPSGWECGIHMRDIDKKI